MPDCARFGSVRIRLLCILYRRGDMMAFLRAAVLIGLILSVVPRSSRAQLPQAGSCPDLTVEANSDCSTLEDCTGLTCTLSSTHTISFSVDQCSDPLRISVAVNSSDSAGPSFFFVFTSSDTQTNGGYTVNLETSRDASYATVQAFSVNGDVIIPYTEIFLNPHECMCESLDTLISNIDSPVETECFTYQLCTGVNCSLEISFDEIYQLEVVLEACQKPPGVLVVILDENGDLVYEEYFNASRSSDLILPNQLIPFPLYVDIVHQNYSMVVEVDLEVFGTEYRLFPKQLIILDKSDCPTDVPTTGTPAVSLPEGVITQETCAALEDVVNLFFLGRIDISCSASPDCNAISCELLGFKMYAEILPCERPPSIYILVTDQRVVVLETVLNETSTFLNVENVASIQVLLTQTQSGITIQVRLIIGPATINLIRKHEIPFEVCYCPGVMCATDVSSSSASSTEEPSSDRISSATVAAITVPIILFMVLIAVAIVAIALAVVVLKKRSPDSEPFPFKAMDETPLDEEDDQQKDIIEPPSNELDV